MYRLKLALRPWRIAPASQWLASLTLGTLLFIFSFLWWFSEGLGPIVNRLSSDQVVTAYVADSAEESSGRIVDEIKTQVGSTAVRIEYVDSARFLTELEKSYPDLAREVASLGNDSKQIAPQYVSIRGSLSATQLEGLKKIPGVESVDSSIERFQPIQESLVATRWITRAFLAAVLVGLLTLLLIMARLNHPVHAEAFRLIEQLGGTRLQAKFPQVANQTLLGIAGGGFAAVAWLASQPWIVEKIHAFSPYLRELPPAPPTAAVAMVAVGAVFGWLTGWMNSGPKDVKA